MTIRRNLSTTLLLMAGSSSLSCAQEEAQAVPQDEAAGEAEVTLVQQEGQPEQLRQDPQICTGRLENGLTYLIRPTKEPAGRASVRLFVDTGSLDESPETSGVAHFIEHLVFNGSRHFKRGELIPTMQRLGLGFGGDANAYTSLLHTVYMLDLPNLEDETVNFAMMIMRDFADGATIEDEAVEKERGIVISEMKSRDSEQYRATIRLMRQVTEGSRVADYMPIGREEVIRNIAPQAVRDYYRSHYVPEKMTLVVTGDFEPAQAEAWIHQHFDSLEKREPLPRQPLNTDIDTAPSVRLITNSEQAHVSVLMNVVKPWAERPDTIERRMEELPLTLATGMFNRRMERMAKRADSPFMHAGADESSVYRAVDMFSVSSVSKPQDWAAALVTTVKELRRAMEYGFSEDELAEVVMNGLKESEKECRSWSTVSAQLMAGRLINGLAENKVCTTPEEDLRAMKTALAKLMADPDQCRQALRKAFDTEHLKLTMTGSLPEGITEEALQETFTAALQQPVEKPEARQSVSFAYDDMGEPGKIVAQQNIDVPGVTTLTLSNGIRINLKPVDFQKGSIVVSAAVEGGTLYNSDYKPGMFAMLDAVMNMGGLEAHSCDELESILAGRNVGVSFESSPSRMTFSGSTDMQDLELQCKLIAAHILHPGFRPEAETLTRRHLDTVFRRMRTSTQGAYSMQVSRRLFGDDKRFAMAEQEEVEANTTDDIRKYVAPFLKDGAMEVTIVGDFELNAVLPILEKTFGAMPERRREFTPVSEPARSVSFRPWGQREFLKYETDLNKTLVSHVRPAGDGMDYRRNRRLQVLVSILREKLFDGIRAAMGESYSPIVSLTYNKEFRNAAFVSTLSAGVVENREKVSAAMDSICSGIGQGNISDDDFERAIRPIITRAQKEERTPEYWLQSLSRIQSEPEKQELLKNRLEDLRSITADEIRNLGREIFGTEEVNFFFTVPDSYTPPTPPAPEEEPVSPIGKEYTVLISEATAALPEWKKVADALVAKYPGAELCVVPDFSQQNCAAALRETAARYAAYVMQPGEVGRDTVNGLHRAARQVDDDPWGDCLWGIVTGRTAADALRIAEAKEPLVIRRLLGTTNLHYAPFEHSYCITDWTDAPVMEQSGYQEPKARFYTRDTEEGTKILTEGMQGLFARQLSEERPQMVVTSSHATQFNLEMPFGRGLIFPVENRFRLLPQAQLSSFGKTLRRAMKGDTAALAELAEKNDLASVEPDGEPRVWIAAGNCLFGDANHSADSMAVTALSAYTCNQLVGYTVPSWYGAGGWGTLSSFMGNTADTTLAQAFFLNNQFLLHKTAEIDPKLLDAEFNEAVISPELQVSINECGAELTPENIRDAVGLVYDRDTLAFYGDPAWAAVIDRSHAPAPFSISWESPKRFTITAENDTQERCGVWFPTAECGTSATGCDAADAVFTDDFILFPTLKMQKGESRTININ